MTEKEIIQIENEIYTKLVMDEFKRQRAEGIKDYLLDKYQIDKETKDRLKKMLDEMKK